MIYANNSQLINTIRKKFHQQLPHKLEDVLKYNKIYYTIKCLRLAEELEYRLFAPQTKDLLRDVVTTLGEYITFRDIDSSIYHRPDQGHLEYCQQLNKIYNVLSPSLEIVKGFFVVYWDTVREDLRMFIEFLKQSSHFTYFTQDQIEDFQSHNYNIDKNTGLYVHERFVYNSKTRTVVFNKYHTVNINSNAIYLT